MWGGMTADPAIFLQTALQSSGVMPLSMMGLNAEGKGLQDTEWRIYSKLGAGYSSTRGRGEIVSSAYGCIPDPSGDRGGLEITITCRGSVEGDYSLAHAQKKVKQAMDEAVEFAKQHF